MYAVATWVATARARKSGRILLVAATSIAAGAITAVLTVLWLGSVRNKPAPLT